MYSSVVKKIKMADKIWIKPANSATTSEISQSLFLSMFAITSDNIITILNNNNIMLSFMCFG